MCETQNSLRQNLRNLERLVGAKRPVNMDRLDAVFYMTYPLLYKYENMVIVRSGNLYSLCSPGNQDYQKIIHF